MTNFIAFLSNKLINILTEDWLSMHNMITILHGNGLYLFFELVWKTCILFWKNSHIFQVINI